MNSLRSLAYLLTVIAGVHAASDTFENLSLAQDVRHPYTTEAENDRVLELPGYGKPDFGLFSG